ncbi:MAG: flagellar basal body-associated FliL family protein [Treponema sp.]|nr:flagellar basal body-associated FliL family protein [Treponema sp.]
MSDTDDIFDDADTPESEVSSKKKRGGGLGSLLPTILKFAAIGLAAVIFIVTVSVITVNIMNRGGRNQTVFQDPSSPYIGRRPLLSFFDGIGQMDVRTRDGYIVQVIMVIGYDEGDQATWQELNSRRFQLRDFTRSYFARKTAADLAPEREEAIKREIREMLNTRFLDSRGVRDILFDRLNVMADF